MDVPASRHRTLRRPAGAADASPPARAGSSPRTGGLDADAVRIGAAARRPRDATIAAAGRGVDARASAGAVEWFAGGARRPAGSADARRDRPRRSPGLRPARPGRGPPPSRWGETASYGEIARRVGAPRAARAVGGAVGRNPISLLIPCHRVIASDGTLGGYGGDGWVDRDRQRSSASRRSCCARASRSGRVRTGRLRPTDQDRVEPREDGR